MERIGRGRVARRWFMALAMVAMAFKALIPVGYMVATVDGRASLIMCPAGIHVHAVPVKAAGMPSMAGMDMSAAGTAHAAHSAQHEGAECPFALATGAALYAAVKAPAARYFELIPRPTPAIPVAVPLAPPPRHEAPRGHPSLA